VPIEKEQVPVHVFKLHLVDPILGEKFGDPMTAVCSIIDSRKAKKNNRQRQTYEHKFASDSEEEVPKRDFAKDASSKVEMIDKLLREIECNEDPSLIGDADSSDEEHNRTNFDLVQGLQKSVSEVKRNNEVFDNISSLLQDMKQDQTEINKRVEIDRNRDNISLLFAKMEMDRRAKMD